MSHHNALVKLGLMCWSTILLGYERGWIEREDIFNYAIAQLEGNDGAYDECVAIIAGGDYLSDEELCGLMFSKMKGVSDCCDLDKWRLAFLLCIESLEASDEIKLIQLQEVYAEFNYPRDMISCSIYSQDNISPLVAMHQVVESLKRRFYI